MFALGLIWRCASNCSCTRRPARLAMFQTLHAVLRREPPVAHPAPSRDGDEAAALAFFEAYFSNYIEGTEFTVDEASAIVFDGRIPADRPADAHDITGTWRMVSDSAEMSRVAQDPDRLLDLLRDRHAFVLQGRPEMRPGEFKVAPNQSDGTIFVKPGDVGGTLEQSFATWVACQRGRASQMTKPWSSNPNQIDDTHALPRDKLIRRVARVGGPGTTPGCGEPAPHKRPCARRRGESPGRCTPSPCTPPRVAGSAVLRQGSRTPCTADALRGDRCRRR